MHTQNTSNATVFNSLELPALCEEALVVEDMIDEWREDSLSIRVFTVNGFLLAPSPHSRSMLSSIMYDMVSMLLLWCPSKVLESYYGALCLGH